jgi:YjbE family integral membrane protein
METELAFAWAVLEIVWIDLLLSGDNAILIALAVRELPRRQRRLGVLLGAMGGLTLRVTFIFVVFEILSAPLLKTAAGLLLILIAVNLTTDHADRAQVEAKPRFWHAVTSIVAADASMSLDNVIAVAAAAKGSLTLVVFGLALSAPILMFGAAAFLRLLDRFTLLIWAGAGLLGWIAGDLIASDPFWRRIGHFEPAIPGVALSVAGASIVIFAAFLIKRAGRWKKI